MLKQDLTGREQSIEAVTNSTTLLKGSTWKDMKVGPAEGRERSAAPSWNSFYKAAALLVLNALVAFACLELAALGYFKIQLPDRSQISNEQLVGEGTAREKVSYYASQDWAERYWHEFRLSRKQQFVPFVGWRRAPFTGQTIEVDENGVRVTPGADCSAKSFKVFAFGASEMWGTGSPNWETIPAHLQKRLEKTTQGPVCVTNFGESAYVSMQGTIMLLLQLRSGNVPDMVVFYTIADDVYAAYQSGRAGALENLDVLVAKFEERRKPDTFLDRLKSTYTYSLVDLLMSKLTVADPQQKGPTAAKLITYESMGVDAATLSDQIGQDYLANYKIVSALGHQYGFKSFFFLPPLVTLGNKPLSPEEQDMKEKTKNEAALYKLFTAVYQSIEKQSSNYPNLHSLVHVFDHVDSLMFIDESHVTPVGNRSIAERMLAVIQGPSAHPQ